ncbi:LacI family DNA-binding transcriptional regulator [Microbacterium sp. YJN-G]|uniref:LacI family DNA-binding transcriptional regulator n=1 Tax=Microbacterium sp. YJN-G TaxID=2763257 RepID=UPI0018776184|nr:LacI family DNA-binding transcriptional regulator [Microbacterium sp. YJN-G]
MTVTGDDVARAAGVSRPAVSQILNGRGRFSPDTIRRVEETAAAMNYRPSAAARTLATGTSDVVIALVPNTTFGTNLQDFVDFLTEELARAGLILVLRFASSPVELLEHFITTVRPRAVIAPFVAPTAAERESIEAAGIALIDLHAEGGRDENHRIGQLQGEYLASKGHRHLVYAHLRDTRLDVFGDAREQGLADYCLAHGIDAPTSIRLPLELDEAVSLLRTLPLGTAIACYNDDVAIALLGAARELGRRVPEDVALMGMDATRIGTLVAPRLTTIKVEAAPAMDRMIRDVVSRVSGSARPARPTDPVVLTVVPGDSA